MLFPNSVRADRGGAPRDLIALDVGQEIVLLGRPSTFADLPRELFRPNIAMMLLRNLSAMPGLRRYLAGHRLAEGLSRLTDRDVLQRVDWAIRSRQLEAIVVIGGYSRNYAGPPIRPGQPAPQAPTGGKMLQPDDPSVASWSNEERIAEVIRRAIALAPGEIAADLRLLLSADGVARVAGSIAFEEAAKPTQHGWATGGAVAGIALAFGGIAGLHALGDVVDFLKRAAEARTPRDLETAAEALARAATALGVPGLLAVLHKAGTRKIADARPPAEELPSFRQLAAAQARRLQARQSSRQGNAEQAENGDAKKPATPTPNATPAAQTASTSGKVPHTDPKKADELIQKHLKIQAKKSIDAGKKIDGSASIVGEPEWSEAGIAHYGETTWNTKKKDNLNGFVDKNGKVWVHKDRGNAATVIHEGVHKYSDEAMIKKSQPLNEGVTEYFTRVVAGKEGMAKGRRNYQENYESAKALSNLVGEETLAKAYFDGNMDGLKEAVDNKQGPGTWDKYVVATKGNRWTDANTLLTPKPPKN